MNRPLFIIIGSVVILILLLVWVYVLFLRDDSTSNNDTGNSGIFSNLDLEDTSLDSDEITNGDGSENNGSSTTESEERKKLRQLTTKQVSGFSEINASTSDVAYFIEAGVGHIYEVDIFTGQEKRISATTFPDTYIGDIDSNGEYFVIQTGYSSNRTTEVGKIDSETQSVTNTKKLEDGVVDFKFFSDQTIGYAVIGTSNITVRNYNPIKDSTETLFTIPFREANIIWGREAVGPHYFYPKPAEGLEGFVYEFSNNQTKRLPLDGFNFSTYGSVATVMASYVDKSKYQTSLFNKETREVSSFSEVVIPSKCIETFDYQIICGHDSSSNMTAGHLTEWHKGLRQFSDNVHRLDFSNNSLSEIANAKAITGRVVDITKWEQGLKYDYLYFINKNDQTLWIYEYEPQIPEGVTDIEVEE